MPLCIGLSAINTHLAKPLSVSFTDFYKRIRGDSEPRFLEKYPNWKTSFVDLADLTTEFDMRNSEKFEIVAIEFFQAFDDVVDNLENLDVALNSIHRTGKTCRFTSPMLKDMKPIFMDSLKQLLGERMTETTEQNYELLYEFVRAEIEKAQSSSVLL